MKKNPLGKSLTSVDWAANSSTFQAAGSHVKRVQAAIVRLAIWSRQFEETDVGNPALSFVRAMQLDGYDCAALTSLALYKPAAASMRAMVESALYYSYFRDHPVELATLLRDARFYFEKTEIIEYHTKHTFGFKDAQDALGVVSRLNGWYKRVSAVIHGQTHGAWAVSTGLAEIKHRGELLDRVVSEFEAAEDVVYRLFLCTAGRAQWADFSFAAKRKLLSGLSGEAKAALALTLA